jgi:predicted acetyltransferase
VDVQVVRATAWDEMAFRNLFQFYLYEFSRFTHWRVTYTGQFFTIDLDGCWTTDTRLPYFIRADNELAGLAIVDQNEKSELSGDANVSELAEFFVMAAYRRQGVGRRAALLLFDQFPGKWEVRQMAANEVAPLFWRNVIGAYSGGQYKEVAFDDERWHGTAQFFEAGAKKPG